MKSRAVAAVLLVAALLLARPAPAAAKSHASQEGEDPSPSPPEEDYSDYEDYGNDCSEWDFESKSKYRYTGGTKVGARLKTASLADCAAECMEADGAMSFNYRRAAKSCTLYEEDGADLEKVKDLRYNAGFIFCADADYGVEYED